MHKEYKTNGIGTEVLKGISLNVGEGEFLCIVGRSGSGKSTLLNVLSTLLTPDSGSILFRGKEITRLPNAELDAVRRTDFSIIFQFHHLLPYLTSLENVLLPFMNSIKRVDKSMQQAAERCLERVGLEGKGQKIPGHLFTGSFYSFR